MSELIRKITGIGGPDEVHYIPVVHYCVCSTAENQRIKIANWIGYSDGTAVSPENFELYKGINIAVLFKNGFGVETPAPNEGFLLTIGDNEPKRMIREQGDIALDKLNPNTAVLFIYDGEDFRLVGGLTSAQFDELQEAIGEQIAGIRDTVVLKGGDFNDETSTGSLDQPVYVNDSKVVAINATFGSPTNPIWINEGHFIASTETVGNQNKPVYLNEGVITAISGTIGGYGMPGSGAGPYFIPVFIDNGEIVSASLPNYASASTVGNDVKPLKMTNGALVPVSNNLATENELKESYISSLSFDENTYELKGLNGYGNQIGATISLPLAELVTSATYDNGYIILGLKNGSSTSFPVANLVNGLVKDPEGQGAGDSAHPVYVDSTGCAVSTTYDLSTFITSNDIQYHNSGSYSMVASNENSGLQTTISGSNNLGAITLNMPVYWGLEAPTGTATTGALYIQLESNFD